MSSTKKQNKAATKFEAVEDFKVKQISEAANLGDDFMDKSVTFTPEAIMAAMQEFYENILTNPKFGILKTQLAAVLFDKIKKTV